MRIFLIRHGQTDWNTEYRVQGHADVPLNEMGKAQARAVAEVLKSEPITRVYSSPLSRALDTASMIGGFHQVDIIVDGGLIEMDLGNVDGLYYPDLETITPDFFRMWTENPAVVRWPGGESLPELQQRVWQTFMAIIEQTSSGSLVIVSHLFVLIVLMCKVLGLDLSEHRKLNLTVGSISILEYEKTGARLLSFNDTCHLDYQYN